MHKEDTTIINIAETLAPVISSRDAVDDLRRSIKRASTIDVALDFSDVQFLSRSAAHRLLIIKEEFANRRLKKKVISFINTNDDVRKMLKLVAASRVLPKEKREFKAKTTDIQSFIKQT